MSSQDCTAKTLKSNLCYDRQLVGQPFLVTITDLGPTPDFYFRLSWVYWSEGALSDGRTCLYLNSCCWVLPAQFLGLGPASPMYILYCLRFKTPTWRTRSPYLYPLGPRNRVPSYTAKHWVPFSSPLTTRRVTIEVFELLLHPVPKSKPKLNFPYYRRSVGGQSVLVSDNHMGPVTNFSFLLSWNYP
jgi:hypothetical protein